MIETLEIAEVSAETEAPEFTPTRTFDPSKVYPGQASIGPSEGNPPVLQDFPKTHFNPKPGPAADNPKPTAFSSGTVETVRMTTRKISSMLGVPEPTQLS